MRVLGLIPARGGSKGVPAKNKKHLGGKPLINYTIETAKKSSLLTDIVVSTDDVEIAEIAKQQGVQVPFIRPVALASDTAKSIDVVQHAISYYENKGQLYDAVCLLQPTTPFRESDSIDQAINSYKLNKLDSLISVLPVPPEYNPHWVFEEVNGSLQISTGEKEIISRRQELPNAYHRDGSIYLTNTDLIKQGVFYGKRMGYVVSNPEMHINIDTMQDWEEAESIIKKS